ncbi:hypothetical protein [Pukyongiella litopenaei]|uniref:Uncharacterized protein n=1 Tax=Pukyongiella litopenaei TaxID=2605946 RepID=A0A2S0MSD1_9RHOB|nr:hypothetical protein [Pukyongiella litopenaei]AVO38641.1 hypothetical protein C6Y53_13695 [Pukyongiella litopenaei]
MSDDDPDWPLPPYDDPATAPHWLRVEDQYPGSGRNSRLVAHWTAPYVAEYPVGDDPNDKLALAASRYLHRLTTFMASAGMPLNLPAGWAAALAAGDILNWLPVWPAVGETSPGLPPPLASWNLSRESDHELPATVVMVAAETPLGVLLSPNVGLRVPMQVSPRDRGGFRVTIRSLTAELPQPGTISLSEIAAGISVSERTVLFDTLGRMLGALKDGYGRARIEATAPVEPGTLSTDEIHFADTAGLIGEPFTVTTIGRARGAVGINPPSLRLETRLDFTAEGDDFTARHIRHCPLVSHAVGEAKVFVRTPADSPFVKKAGARYRFSRRRPAAPDPVLDEFREYRRISGHVNAILKDTGFRVRQCPRLVHTDTDGNATKVVDLDGTGNPQPRRDDFSAISAFYNARAFFDLMAEFGLPPSTYVVRAQQELQVFYRAGITPGPGGSGNTVNAQVAYDCTTADELPFINLNLALADLARRARPAGSPGKQWAQPLGIAASGRWMLHEAGHYLLAARIGQLEFDFAHSPGDALAAVAHDPTSRLADPRRGVNADMRFFTYPFVFAPRRHDRSPLQGWGWYGYLNRAVIEQVPGRCGVTKGYLSEQILSTTVFRLYRALGGDTLNAAGDPDHLVRRRAAAVTLFLLIRAIAGLAQSPSRAEALELGMEDVSLTMTQSQIWSLAGGDGELIPVPHQPEGSAPQPAPTPVPWQGGVAHKVVRWAFEAQGMFPGDPTQIQHGPGLAPPVDIYIRDRRPESETTEAGPVRYGPGSYRPVSLHFGADMDWTMAEPFEIGNRGQFPATGIKLRAWVGLAIGPGSADWENSASIVWAALVTFTIANPIAPGDSLVLPDDILTDALAEFEVAPQVAFLLVELSCPFDRANTDPAAGLACAVTGTDGLPGTPRALADLVAGDNNLGLLVGGV